MSALDPLRAAGAALSRSTERWVPDSWGIIVQFPFYAGIFGVMTGTGLGAFLGDLFARFASAQSFPAVVYVYAAVMNPFVPSGGSKWLIEAPYLIPAGAQLGVSLVCFAVTLIVMALIPLQL
jgi:short-chain fatty acids transporter